jgi:hypothetical protein
LQQPYAATVDGNAWWAPIEVLIQEIELLRAALEFHVAELEQRDHDLAATRTELEDARNQIQLLVGANAALAAHLSVAERGKGNKIAAGLAAKAARFIVSSAISGVIGNAAFLPIAHRVEQQADRVAAECGVQFDERPSARSSGGATATILSDTDSGRRSDGEQLDLTDDVSAEVTPDVGDTPAGAEPPRAPATDTVRLDPPGDEPVAEPPADDPAPPAEAEAPERERRTPLGGLGPMPFGSAPFGGTGGSRLVQQPVHPVAGAQAEEIDVAHPGSAVVRGGDE